MANDSELEKNAPPDKRVTVSLPALIRSASTSFSSGYGPFSSYDNSHKYIDCFKRLIITYQSKNAVFTLENNMC